MSIVDAHSNRQYIRARPSLVGNGEAFAVIDRGEIDKSSELAVTLDLITRRRLFGYLYAELLPKYFWSMPKGSGVFVKPVVPTNAIAPGADRPGDIDLLIIPYEDEELVLDQTLAVEIKVIRSSYQKQGRSPNDYGYSQALGLRKIGFPFVAVAHLIMSDRSPINAWREIGVAEVIGHDGEVSPIRSVSTDVLPLDLIKRSYGRLASNCPDDGVGLVCSYIANYGGLAQPAEERSGHWLPLGRPAIQNDEMKLELLQSVADHFHANPSSFLDNPRFDPPTG